MDLNSKKIIQYQKKNKEESKDINNNDNFKNSGKINNYNKIKSKNEINSLDSKNNGINNSSHNYLKDTNSKLYN